MKLDRIIKLWYGLFALLTALIVMWLLVKGL
jgi:hypothetical protein